MPHKHVCNATCESYDMILITLATGESVCWLLVVWCLFGAKTSASTMMTLSGRRKSRVPTITDVTPQGLPTTKVVKPVAFSIWFSAQHHLYLSILQQRFRHLLVNPFPSFLLPLIFLGNRGHVRTNWHDSVGQIHGMLLKSHTSPICETDTSVIIIQVLCTLRE